MNSRFFLRKKTFTLIEMLIVIVIIGILAAALIPRLQSVQGRARDTKRKADIRSIYNANEIFLLDNGQYARPANAFTAYNYNTDESVYSWQTGATVFWIADLSGALASIPVDPINSAPYPTVLGNRGPWLTGNYVYAYYRAHNSASGLNTYTLIAQLENTQDAERCELKQYRSYFNGNKFVVCVVGLPASRNEYIYAPNVN